MWEKLIIAAAGGVAGTIVTLLVTWLVTSHRNRLIQNRLIAYCDSELQYNVDLFLEYSDISFNNTPLAVITQVFQGFLDGLRLYGLKILIGKIESVSTGKALALMESYVRIRDFSGGWKPAVSRLSQIEEPEKVLSNLNTVVTQNQSNQGFGQWK